MEGFVNYILHGVGASEAIYKDGNHVAALSYLLGTQQEHTSTRVKR